MHRRGRDGPGKRAGFVLGRCAFAVPCELWRRLVGAGSRRSGWACKHGSRLTAAFETVRAGEK